MPGSSAPFERASVDDAHLGDNLFNITHEPWLSRRRTLQPLFTKKHVAIYASRMADIAQTSAATWAKAGSIDLDKETLRLTMRVLGQSLFGLDLGAQAEALGPPLNRAVQFVTDRSLQPVRAPAWLPTFARHRFRTAKDVIDRTIDDAITAVQGDPGRNAELIRLFFDTTDPVTGNGSPTGRSTRSCGHSSSPDTTPPRPRWHTVCGRSGSTAPSRSA